MTHKTIAIILMFIALVLILWQPQPEPRKQILTKTYIGTNGDADEYTYATLYKTCYEEVKQGQVVSQHCN